MTSQWEGGRVLAGTVGGGPPAVQSWEPVSVPGRPERFAGAPAVAYRLQFADPRSTPAQRALLEFQGLYGHARVWLNGELLGTHREYFAPARFEFEPAAENELVVECHRPPDGFGGAYETDHVADALAVPGIWWGVHLRLRPPAFLRDLVVNPRLTDDGGAIDVAVSVDAAEPVAEPVTLSLRPEGFRGGGAMEREQVEAGPGERITVTRTLTLREPSLWWPRNHGEQHRYVVRAKFRDHELTTTTALRSVDYGADGGLRVNGKRVRARGVNLLPSDDQLADFERVDEAGFTLARLHAHVAPPELYEAADEAGVLVWQDCPLSGEVRVDAERGRAVARTLANTVDHHPSVALFGVHDDPETPFDGRMGGGRMDRLRFRRRVGGETDARGTAERIAGALPADRPVFPICGQPGIGPDAAHLYPGWTFGDADAVDWLCATVPELTRVVTEFGAGSLTEAGAKPTGLDREVHDAVVGSDDPATSQAVQARTLKRVAETLRLQGADVLAGFRLRDADGGGGMGVLDSAGEPKPAYEALSTSLRPVVPVLREVPTPGAAVEARLLNDAPAEVEGTVRWSFEGPPDAVDTAGEAVSVAAPAFESVAAGEVTVPADATAVSLALETGTTAVVNRYRL
ncbi:glycosyl hydrolase 2 galactose-binding domain-containing protein [Haloarchaeobius baliensis]|uniref:glycosyl hydrolase 2 galactose-binding domain-containing protein n=1 Tax=Haloarchaeobius baliensis TaxID=1670458 RepID=UPI003F8856D4